MAAETIHVRGEGGSIIAMDLPLPEPIAQRLAAGQIVRVHPDGTPWSEFAATPAATRSEAAPASVDEPQRPGKSASKSAWVDYAVATGMDRATAQAMTRDDLVEHLTD